MLSRVAESIYWMSRYIERAENVARFIGVNQNLLLDDVTAHSQQWMPLIAAIGDDDIFLSRYKVASEENVMRFLTFDLDNPNSIATCIAIARENARTVRDAISSEMWEQVNYFHQMVKQYSQRKKFENLQELYSKVKLAGHLFEGVTDSTMTHGEGWHFSQLGRMLERADKTARILDVKYFYLLPDVGYVESPLDSIVWGALLTSVSGFEMYRKQYNRIFSKDVVDFLVNDPLFPRSVNHCIEQISVSLSFIVAGINSTPSAITELELLKNLLHRCSTEQVIDMGLHEFIDLFQIHINRLGEAIHNSFFTLKKISN